MWSYYGSKSKIVHLYPKPKYGRIVEPFAGSARYSLLHWDHDVMLVDKYEVVIRIWRWLQKCSPKDILGLPKLKQGDRISREMFDCDEQFWLMGFMVSAGVASPRKQVTEMADGNSEVQKRSIASQLHKIRCWRFILGDYRCLANIEATWFIDPPYWSGGEGYVQSSKSLDFQHLADWCKDRKGQAIVCENTKANWLPFKPIKTIGSIRAESTTEAIWSNLPTDYDAEQLSLFGREAVQ